MFNLFKNLFFWNRKKPLTLMLIGLDNAGKTTLLGGVVGGNKKSSSQLSFNRT